MLKLDVPEGSSGDWTVDRFAVDKLGSMMTMFGSDPWRGVPEGVYTRLTHRGKVIMSDTPAEVREHFFLSGQTGIGLMNGLGLGVGIELAMRTCDHLFAIELSYDVIQLVGPHYWARYPDRLTIIHCDAFAYQPPRGQTSCQTKL